MVFNGTKSDVFYPSLGVPQGSILGLLLFVLYIDDLAAALSPSKWLYADDTKMGRVINDESDCVGLQQDINTLER